MSVSPQPRPGLALVPAPNAEDAPPEGEPSRRGIGPVGEPSGLQGPPGDAPHPPEPGPDGTPDPARGADGVLLPPPPPRARLSDILQKIATDPRLERVSIGDIVAAMPGRATAALLFLFAAPNAIPTPPGTSALLGLPMIYLALQMMLRHKPWLPKVVAQRSMRLKDFAALVNRAVPLLTRAERMLRPRLLPLVSPAAEVAIGAFCLILALSVALPIPLGNMLPALAVSVLALGVLERDGLWVIIGTALGALSLMVVGGVVWAAVKTFFFLLGHAFD